MKLVERRWIFRYLIPFLLILLGWVFIHDPKGLGQGREADLNPVIRFASLRPSNPSGIEKNCISEVSLSPGGLSDLVLWDDDKKGKGKD